MMHKPRPMEGPPMDAPHGGPDAPLLAEALRHAPPARHRAPQRVVRLGLARHMSLMVGVVLLAFGLLQWLPAASLTVLGWTAWLTQWRGWFGLGPLELTPGTPFVLVSCTVGLLYSLIEIEAIPVRWEARRLMIVSGATLLAWLFLAGTDIVSTYDGLLRLPATMPPWAQTLVADPVMRGLAAVYLTFAPDRAIVLGYRLVRRSFMAR